MTISLGLTRCKLDAENATYTKDSKLQSLDPVGLAIVLLELASYSAKPLYEIAVR